MSVILSIVFSLLGFSVSFGMDSVLGICLGLAVVTVLVLMSSMRMPPLALILAAVASLAIAGYQLVEMRSLYTQANSYSIKLVCEEMSGMMEADDDFTTLMMEGFYSEYTKYCGSAYKKAMAWHGMAMICWMISGVLIFLVPRADNKREAMLNLDDGDEPVTDYEKQTESDQKNGGELA